MTHRPGATILLAAIALAAVGLTYFDAWHLGFFWDDYLLLRPRPWAELLRVWHGSWDATGVVPAFYRPLAVWADTAAFAVLGFDEVRLRLAALLQLAIGAWLIGEVVRRESDGFWPGAFATMLYAVHPVVSSSAGPWWFEQNHRLSLICVAVAVLAWQARRGDMRWLAWWPVHVWILAGSWFKEDVFVLSPILLLFQWWRARTAGDVMRPSMRFAVECGTAWLAWFAMRWWLLGTLSGFPTGPPVLGWGDRLSNVARGPWLTFLRIRAMNGEVAPVHRITTVLLIFAVAAGLLLWLRGTSPRARLLLGYGVAAAALFNVPVSIASYPTRYHLLAFSAALFFTGVGLAVTDSDWGAFPARSRRVVAATGGVILAACLALSSRAAVNYYRPCTPANLEFDQELRDWLRETPQWRESWILPWLAEKAERCAAGRYVRVTEAIPDVLRAVAEGRQ